MIRKSTIAALVLMFAAPPALADGCDGLTQVMTKQFYLPHRIVIVGTRPNAADITLSVILAGGKTYTTFDPAKGWGVANETPETAEAHYRQRVAAQGQVCHPDGSEVIGGETFDITAYHETAKDGAIDGRVWISHTTNLPLKSEDVFASGLHSTTTYEYKGVEAPTEKLKPLE